MGDGSETPGWQGSGTKARTEEAQAEATKTTADDAKRVALGQEEVRPAGLPARKTAQTVVAPDACVEPAAVKDYALPCAQIPKTLRELFRELMEIVDLIVTYNAQAEPKRCRSCIAYARRDLLQISAGRAKVLTEGEAEEKVKEPVPAGQSDLRGWYYDSAGDDTGRIKYGAVTPLLNATLLPRELGMGYLTEEQSIRRPSYVVPAKEQQIAKSDALDRLNAIMALPAFVHIFRGLARTNPRIHQQLHNQLQSIVDYVKAWQLGLHDKGTDGGWKILAFPVVECAQLPRATPTPRGEKLEKVDLEKEAGEPVEEGPPSRRLPEIFLSLSVTVDESTRRAFAELMNGRICDLQSVHVEFQHGQPISESQAAAEVVEDLNDLRLAVSAIRGAVSLFDLMKRQATIVLRGYTDRSGAPKFDNDALSVLRAQWMAGQIRSALGLDARQVQLKTIGCGDRFANKSQLKHRASRVVVATYQ